MRKMEFDIKVQADVSRNSMQAGSSPRQDSVEEKGSKGSVHKKPGAGNRLIGRDFLTGLLNRHSAAGRIRHLISSRGREALGALILIDIDDFKSINHKRGSLFGDSVLAETAKCIRDASGKRGVVGRVGGDEFIVFLHGVSSREDILVYAEQVRERLSECFNGKDRQMDLECSMGAAVYPKDAYGYESLVSAAAAALLACKRWKRGECVCYSPSCEGLKQELEGERRVLSGSRIHSDSRFRSWDNQLCYYVFKMLYEAPDIRGAINIILKIIGLRYNVSRVYIFEDSPNGLSVDNTFEWCNEGISSQIDNLQNLSYEKSLTGYKNNFDEKGIFFCEDIESLPPSQQEVLRPQGIKSILQCGIYDAGRFVGFIGFDECVGSRRWDKEQVEALTFVAQIVGTFLMKDRAQAILRQKLFALEHAMEGEADREALTDPRPEQYDSLTSLLTVGAFQEEMEEYLKNRPHGEEAAAFILDMDDFKKVNETRGRLFGNVVLMNVANSLKRACLPGDLIARFGGDEFLVLLKNADMEKAAQAASSMQEDISSLLSDADQEDIKIRCSIGIHMIGEDESEFSDIIVKADQAMNQVKESGKNGVQFYAFIADKGEGRFTYDRLRQTGDEKKKEQTSRLDKTSTAVTLEVFEKARTFEEAMHILMGYIGNRFRLNRIVFYMNQGGGEGEQTVYQWVDDRTAALVDPTHSFRREEFYICYNLYDGDGLALLERRDYDAYSIGLRKVLDRARARTMLFAGVFIEGRYLGMLVLVNTEREREWARTERTAVSEMARIVASGVKNSLRLMEARQEAEYYKNRDNLTGLMRYEKFKEECQKILDSGEDNYVLVASDIKGFKFINEAVGYTQGDNILRMFADMLNQNGRAGNLYTRASADQFIAFGVLDTDRGEFIRMIQKLNDDFCRIQNEIYAKLNMMIRSGVYFIDKDCHEIETAVDRATIARKSVDYIIRSTSVVYNDGPFDSSFRENEIINRMEYALRHEEFKVYLQPKFSLGDCRLAGAEALVRWQREDGSIVGPGDFIPLFEKNGFISQIDFYVFKQVCKKLKEWIDEGGQPITISVNLSSVDLAVEQIVSDILECTDHYGLDHRYLEFELTETAFLKESGLTCNVMKLLQDYGFTTAIDDFGSGYSIMNMMADIPTDVIKLDCGFVQSCEKTGRGREFLGQLVQMTNKMGYISLCEGIETREQLDMLTEMGCQIGQGFYFSRPIPMNEFFEKFCKKNN